MIVDQFNNFKRKVYYFFRKKIILIPNIINKNKKHKYLFILSPPYCGSTLLNQIISTSKHVSCNNNIGTREGQTLPEVKNLMFDNNRWNEDIHLPWKKIKKIWRKHWNLSKPILLDKSIPNIMRLNQLKEAFFPALFICIIRNPYALCEGIMRRTGKSAKFAAEFTIKCFTYQIHNINNHKEILFFTYEDLCDNQEKIIKHIKDYINDLEDIDINQKFKAHNFKTKKAMKITNLNNEKINKLQTKDLEAINKVFIKNVSTLNFFNYQIIKQNI